MKGEGIPTFKPYNMSDAEFRQKVATLNAENRVVIISLGGADSHIELHKGKNKPLPMKSSVWLKFMDLMA